MVLQTDLYVSKVDEKSTPLVSSKFEGTSDENVATGFLS